ncbi:MAG: hypothetical protein KJ645_12875 [Planctomycetes bacterium]|nr:hypothetical protein [Planctomycetota bacterium]
MRKKIHLLLLILAVLSCAMGGCRRQHSHSADLAATGGPPGGEDPGGNDPGGEDPGGSDPGGNEPPGVNPDDPTAASIWIYEDEVELTDPNSGQDGIALPGEIIHFSIIVRNTGESLGRVDLTDLNIFPDHGLTILTRRLDGSSIPDFNQIEIPGGSFITLTGTAQVSTGLTPPLLVTFGPPEVIPSSPPTDPETVIDPEQILGSGAISIEADEPPPPPPPPPDDEIHHTRQPGSLLLFPFYRVEESTGNNGILKDTLITVTNMNAKTGLNAHGLPKGTIDVRFVYLSTEDCLPFDRWERLTPYDTFSVMVSNHIPWHGSSEGWLYIHAVDTETGESLDFDHLIGKASYFDSENLQWASYNPLSFQGVPGEGLPTDLDLDGNCDLNGLEYTCLGDNQMFPRFIATFDEGSGPSFRTDLVLVNLSGGVWFNTSLKFLVFNDNEQAWSATHDFWCWEVTPLEEFGYLFTNEFLQGSNHDWNEDLTLFGKPDVETGWFKMDGDLSWSGGKSIEDPAFVSLLMEWYNGRLMITPPFDNGIQQDNATLWNVSVHGDNED